MKTLLFFLIAMAVSFAESVVLKGTGYGADEQQAISYAKRDALEKGIGQFLMSHTEIENFMLKKDVVLTRTAGHVKNYKVLSKSQGPDGAWKVTIQATVSKSDIDQDLAALGILIHSIGNPRVAFLLEEKVGSEGVDYAQMAFLNEFQNRNFEVVDPNSTTKFKESKDAISALGGNPEAAAKLGALVNAEVLIVGTVKSQEADLSQNAYFKGTGMKSVSSTISLKAFDVGSRKILAAGNASASGVDPNPMKAAMKATQKSVKKMMERKEQFFQALLKTWNSKANDGANFELVIENVKSFSLAKEVKQVLANGSENVEQRSFKKPTLTVQMKFMGTAGQLAEHLENRSVGELKLKVQEVMGTKIKLNLE